LFVFAFTSPEGMHPSVRRGSVWKMLIS
jgi:hypothetical protein